MFPVSSADSAGPLPAFAADRPSNDPIFAIHGEAVRRAQAGESIIDASLGALVEDDGRLAVMPTVFEAFRGVDPARAAAYAPIEGDRPFREAVIHDVFGDGPLSPCATAVATAGGTGALHHAVVNFLERGQALYTTSWHWTPYGVIAEHTGRRVETFSMFTADGRFDLAAFEEGLVALVKAQGRALVILNFPCHNPTGYTLDDFEWKSVVEILRRSATHGPVTLCVDMAYARYAPPGSERWVESIEPLLGEVTVLAAWSASKSFAQYGARVGALIAVVQDDGMRAKVQSALSYSCRGTWSNCNHLGIIAVESLLSDPELRAHSDRDRARLLRLLADRVDAFNTEAAKAELLHPRYESGFFVSVFTPDPARTAASCAADGVFVVPLQGAVRVALCSTSRDQVPRLVASLAKGVAAAS